MSFKKSLLHLSLLTACLLGIVWSVRSGGDTCQDSTEPTRSMPTRLPIGSQGRVTLDGGSNNVREQPNLTDKKLGSLPPGSTFTVINGFSCSENALWIQVDNGAGLVGWTVEIFDGEYALEPIPGTNAPTATPRPLDILPEPILSSIPAPAVFPPGAVDYQSIHFVFDASLATQVNASFALTQEEIGLTYPAALVFDFLKETNGELLHVGSIRIWSADDFRNHFPTTTRQLRGFLSVGGDSQSAIPSEMMALVSNSGLLINVHNRLFPFGSGQAFRRLSLYTGVAYGFSNTLTYEAHALSSDDLYYVNASFTTQYNDAVLFNTPDDVDDPAIAQSVFETFHTQLRTTLESAPEEAFSPNPSQIDDVFSSLTIGLGIMEEIVAQAGEQAAVMAPQESVLLTQQAGARATGFANLTAVASATQGAITPTATQNATLLTEQASTRTAGIAKITQAAGTRAPGLTATAEAQCGTLNPKLQIGLRAQQILSGNSSLRVRDAAGGKAIPETFLYPGDEVMVTEGPVCVDEVNWWQVTSLTDGWTGWISEGNDGDYYMNPVLPTSTPRPPTAVPTKVDYHCSHQGSYTTNEVALLEPRVDGIWQYYVSPGDTSRAIGQYRDDSGQIWYLFAPDSRLSGFEGGGGDLHLRSFWGTEASGSGCSSVPRVPGTTISR